MTNGLLDSLKEMHSNQVSGSYIVFLRLTLGFAFLTTWVSNFLKGVFTPDGYTQLVSYYIDNNVGTPYNFVVEALILPNVQIFSFAQIILELIIAFTLILGIFTRFGAILGFFVSSNLFFLTLGVEGEWIWTYIMMIISFLVVALYSAGKWYGIDYWLEKKVSNKVMHYLLF